MHVLNRTVTAVLDAPKDEVFDYLSRVENLPEWATDFAPELKYGDGEAKVVNGLGELYFRIDADAKRGVIDMYAGPRVEELALYPTRVVPLGEEKSAYSASHRVVFPIPASPDSTATPGRSSRASRSRTISPSSASLPTSCGAMTDTFSS